MQLVQQVNMCVAWQMYNNEIFDCIFSRKCVCTRYLQQTYTEASIFYGHVYTTTHPPPLILKVKLHVLCEREFDLCCVFHSTLLRHCHLGY